MNGKDALKILRGVSKKMIRDRQEHEENFCGHDLDIERQEINQEYYEKQAELDYEERLLEH